ncbi:MAG: response regulator [Candidatus Methylomirabilales bacterium]
MRNRPILVVDDDPRSCELVAAILTNADFDVLSAADGPAAIELARTAYPAVIILDMMMPEMDGISTLQRLKRDPALKDIPVIGVTASMDLTYTERAFRAGAQFFLPKPFRATSLLRVVELAADSAHRDTPMHRRRRHPRHPAEVPVCCFVHGDKDTTWEVMGKTGNVSLGGMLLLLPQTLVPGTALQLGLGLPEGPITAKGSIMWQHPEPMSEGNFHHGVRLLGFMEDAGLLRYRRYLSKIGTAATS